jgi:spore coat polysaccharide biosynthesis protein SpsF
MGSERLPGKTMAPLAGVPALRHVINRLAAVPNLDGVIVATTTAPRDDAICECAVEAGVRFFRGSEDDVLGRMVEAAGSVLARVIVRVTGDCPLIDPRVVEAVIASYIDAGPDYACNFLGGQQFPRGMEVEVFAAELLASIGRETTARRDREHVTPMFYEHPERFRLLGVTAPPSERRPELRLTLDTEEDYALISAIYDALFPKNPIFGLTEVLKLLERRPELATVNAGVTQRVP